MESHTVNLCLPPAPPPAQYFCTSGAGTQHFDRKNKEVQETGILRVLQGNMTAALSHYTLGYTSVP